MHSVSRDTTVHKLVELEKVTSVNREREGAVNSKVVEKTDVRVDL
jgi:hypothetical protein